MKIYVDSITSSLVTSKLGLRYSLKLVGRTYSGMHNPVNIVTRRDKLWQVKGKCGITIIFNTRWLPIPSLQSLAGKYLDHPLTEDHIKHSGSAIKIYH